MSSPGGEETGEGEQLLCANGATFNSKTVPSPKPTCSANPPSSENQSCGTGGPAPAARKFSRPHSCKPAAAWESGNPPPPPRPADNHTPATAACATPAPPDSSGTTPNKPKPPPPDPATSANCTRSNN